MCHIYQKGIRLPWKPMSLNCATPEQIERAEKKIEEKRLIEQNRCRRDFLNGLKRSIIRRWK